MRVQIYTGSERIVAKSGVGQAIAHQREALKRCGVEVTDRWEKGIPILINTVLPDAAITAAAARLAGRKVIYFGHSTMEDFRRSFVGSDMLAPVFKRWISCCYRLGNCVITPTNYSAEILRNYDIDRPIHPVSNGVDTRFFAPSRAFRDRFRKKYRLREQDKVVISAGHLIDRKGLKEYVFMAKRMPKAQFFWFGDKSAAGIPAEIRAVIKGAPKNLRFPGFISQEELRDAYCGADLFAFLSKEETEGIVVLEALACGVPVLLRDIPVYHDWLTDGREVYMAEEDFHLTAEKIFSDELPDLRVNGRRFAESRSLEQTGEKLRSIIGNL